MEANGILHELILVATSMYAQTRKERGAAASFIRAAIYE
jgi:hypothetical protein